jgi:hypothetical protein
VERLLRVDVFPAGLEQLLDDLSRRPGRWILIAEDEACQHLIAMNDDYSDIEVFILQWTAAGPSIELLCPHFGRWRHQLLENGIEKVSVYDALAGNLMVAFIRDAMPRTLHNRQAMHDHRNLLYVQGAPMLRKRGWKP